MTRTTSSLTRWLRQRHARNLLLAMDDRMLADIGVARSEIDLYVSGARER
ncbi:hypothetical protein K32_29780 [Kaistia sp. 32K]|nr:DUF1127 domain-containing protein [Kaistia sp. 32K]BCP54361.1 hypothetical protein K32_29780 [Kaistia sp. 32K]